MNLLFFHLEVHFGQDIRLIANNEVDLKIHLEELGFKKIEFTDLIYGYGTCALTDQDNEREHAKCFYVKKV
jgi:hypothetical protein